MERSNVLSLRVGEYTPIYAGLAEADKVYGVVLFARISATKATRVEMRVMFYLFENGELISNPVSGCYVNHLLIHHGFVPLKNMKKIVKMICRAIASCGINIYDVRDETLNTRKLLDGGYEGSVFIYGSQK